MSMHSSPGRFSRLRLIVTVMTALAMAGGGVLLGLGASKLPAPQGMWMLAAGASAVCLFFVAAGLVSLLIKIESNTARQYGELRDIQETLERHREKLAELAESARISDDAKRITHREEERAALRNAIYDDVRREDWEAAFHLVEEMKTRFGYLEESERLRAEVTEARTESMRKKMAAAAARLEKLFAEHKWDQADKEIQRLRRALPDERRVARLEDELRERRQQHKADLLKSWNEALRRNDLDEGITILKALDAHLTREEARELEESARSLFKEKLMQLGVQFRFAVTERRWLDALEVGLQITEEFPNSRMAKEVQEHMNVLRQRAGLTTDVEVTTAGGLTA